MKRKIIGLVFVLLFGTFSMEESRAEMDPKMKALASMALYGTIGGVLLGTASLAFGTEPRSIAKGASLGLYAGLLFGGYVVVSHVMKKSRDNQPPPQDYYPEEADTPYIDDGDADYGDAAPYDQRWAGYYEYEEASRNVQGNSLTGPKVNSGPVYFLNLLKYTF